MGAKKYYKYGSAELVSSVEATCEGRPIILRRVCTYFGPAPGMAQTWSLASDRLFNHQGEEVKRVHSSVDPTDFEITRPNSVPEKVMVKIPQLPSVNPLERFTRNELVLRGALFFP
jgi:hypothetical protein